MDLRLTAEFGVHGLHGETIGLHPTVATALAHGFIDDHAQGGFGRFAALAMAAFFGSALLVVDQHRGARGIAQHPLGAVEFVPIPCLGVVGQGGPQVLVGVFGYDDRAPHPFRLQLAGELGDR
jgi:hypothetical protein